VLLHQEFESLDVLGDDGVFALEDRGPVERGRADAGDPELDCVLEVVPDFGGMQPTCKQVPPSRGALSMSATFSPYSAPRIAAVYPAGPPPMMATS
jgi:hypothetical protein